MNTNQTAPAYPWLDAEDMAILASFRAANGLPERPPIVLAYDQYSN